MAPDWWEALAPEFSKPYMEALRGFLKAELHTHTIYPPMEDIFNAFLYTPLNEVRVVILGQDPYHGAQQAHGLCFSVKEGVKPPPSLINVFKEIKSDITTSLYPQDLRPALQNWEDKGSGKNISGELTAWAKQGVFLLNTVLTVRASSPGSHRNQGWEELTNQAIRTINHMCSQVVFLLWGSFAQQKVGLIDNNKHLLLKAPHPSPFSADRGFFGCKHFSSTNTYLRANGKKPILW